jgi:hypothetical protein
MVFGNNNSAIEIYGKAKRKWAEKAGSGEKSSPERERGRAAAKR